MLKMLKEFIALAAAPALIFAIITFWFVYGMACALERLSESQCRQRGEIIGAPARYETSGCYLLIDGKWIPYSAWRYKKKGKNDE